MNERQELWCHGCNRYVQFTLDLALNGNHVIVCPVCGHEHCRVVRNGQITEDRWNFAGLTYYASPATMTTSATNWYLASSSGSTFTTDSWVNLSSGTTNGYW